MAICRTHLRQIAARHDSPAVALGALNRALSAEIDGSLYVTMVYAIIDTAANEVVFARAGHELPLFVHAGAAGADRVTEFVGSEGMPLGMVSDEIFSVVIGDRRVPFAPGATLVLYTDGLTEAPNEDDQEFSGARLASLVHRLDGQTAQVINDGILAAVQRFTGDTAQRDDFTLVTVNRV